MTSDFERGVLTTAFFTSLTTGFAAGFSETAFFAAICAVFLAFRPADFSCLISALTAGFAFNTGFLFLAAPEVFPFVDIVFFTPVRSFASVLPAVFNFGDFEPVFLDSIFLSLFISFAGLTAGLTILLCFKLTAAFGAFFGSAALISFFGSAAFAFSGAFSIFFSAGLSNVFECFLAGALSGLADLVSFSAGAFGAFGVFTEAAGVFFISFVTAGFEVFAIFVGLGSFAAAVFGAGFFILFSFALIAAGFFSGAFTCFLSGLTAAAGVFLTFASFFPIFFVAI
ncbi:MAG: hypothetical protein ACD_47C00385G0002 [uncultured bacterium]|nr:MAG: hypothetical protein ACD_47C00385G0002 [uncultured bacterium]